MLHFKFLTVACVLALVINASAAKAAGHGGSGWHGGGSRSASARHRFGGPDRYHGGGQYGGGYLDNPIYYVEPVVDASSSQPLGPAMPPSLSLNCHHSQEIVDVPSEDGGERQITITRC